MVITHQKKFYYNVLSCRAIGKMNSNKQERELEMNYYINPDIKNTERIFPSEGRQEYYRFDMNENPEGLPEDFIKEVLSNVTPSFLAMYPEAGRFLKLYASFIGVKEENITATNGSDMAIRYLFETFGEKARKVVTVSPSFEMYRINCSILGMIHVPVRYEENLTIKVEKIIDAIDNDTRIVVLLNPNNPIGNVYTQREFEQIVFKAQVVGAIVIVDEAYHYFYSKSFLEYTLKYDNVVILRTFSKLFSLAACRLGVVISNPKVIQYLRRAKLSFDVNAIALLFGEKILEHPEIIENLIKMEREGKAYILKTLQKRGYYCRDCTGNFIFLEPRNNPQEVARRLEKEKVLVHTYSDKLLSKYIRVSTGSKEAMSIFLDKFLKIDF